MCNDTAGSHLALKYHHEGIDRSQRRPQHLVLPFNAQPARKGPERAARTPAALGPGAYGDAPPATWTGRHVSSGHAGSGMRGAVDFARALPRRPLSASAALPGGGPGCVAASTEGSTAEAQQALGPVPETEAQAALHNLLDHHLDPSMLISVHALHEAAEAHGIHLAPPHRPQRRPHSAVCYRPVPAGVGRGGRPPRPSTARPAAQPVRAAAAVVAATAGSALGDCCSGGGGGGEAGALAGQPQVSASLTHEQLARYASGGLRTRGVLGGSFSRTTREQHIQSLRVVADGRVIPPASAPLAKIRPSQAADVMYDAVPDTAVGHHTRAPAWQLPPNQTSLSRQWVSTLALAHV
jgi:hypothetical protein